MKLWSNNEEKMTVCIVIVSGFIGDYGAWASENDRTRSTRKVGTGNPGSNEGK